jgi:hypothetical protein
MRSQNNSVKPIDANAMRAHIWFIETGDTKMSKTDQIITLRCQIATLQRKIEETTCPARTSRLYRELRSMKSLLLAVRHS